jgi:hypothetical protein
MRATPLRANHVSSLCRQNIRIYNCTLASTQLIKLNHEASTIIIKHQKMIVNHHPNQPSILVQSRPRVT